MQLCADFRSTPLTPPPAPPASCFDGNNNTICVSNAGFGQFHYNLWKTLYLEWSCTRGWSSIRLDMPSGGCAQGSRHASAAHAQALGGCTTMPSVAHRNAVGRPACSCLKRHPPCRGPN